MSNFYPGTGGTGDSVPGHGQGLEQDWGLGPLVPAGTGRSVLAWCMGLPVPSPGLFVAWTFTHSLRKLNECNSDVRLSVRKSFRSTLSDPHEHLAVECLSSAAARRQRARVPAASWHNTS